MVKMARTSSCSQTDTAPTMPAFATLLGLLVATCRMTAALANACVVVLHVVWSVIQEAKKEAVELMALLDDDALTMVCPCRWPG